MHKCFISYYHDEDQKYKDYLSRLAEQKNLFDDVSIEIQFDDTGLSTDQVFNIIRDQYLKDSSVTIVILGPCTKSRKFVDREIGASLRKTSNFPRCGLVVLRTPEFENLYGNSITQENSGERIADNYRNGYGVFVSLNAVIQNPQILKQKIEEAYQIKIDKNKNPDNSAPYRSRNSECRF